MVGMNKTTIIAVISDDSVLKCERRRQFTSDLLRSTLPLLAAAFTGPWPNYFSNVRHGREISLFFFWDGGRAEPENLKRDWTAS